MWDADLDIIGYKWPSWGVFISDTLRATNVGRIIKVNQFALLQICWEYVSYPGTSTSRRWTSLYNALFADTLTLPQK